MTVRLFLIAGELSGDALGGALIAGLRALVGDDLVIEGIGGPAMAAQGLTSRFPMEELSVMGVAEVLPRLPNLLRRIRETGDAVAASAPDALVTIDSPDFTLRVAGARRSSARSSRSSTTSPLRSGPGDRGGRRRWPRSSTTCSRSCPSSRPTWKPPE